MYEQMMCGSIAVRIPVYSSAPADKASHSRLVTIARIHCAFGDRNDRLREWKDANPHLVDAGVSFTFEARAVL